MLRQRRALARAAVGVRAHVLHLPAVAVRGQLTPVVKAFVISSSSGVSGIMMLLLTTAAAAAAAAAAATGSPGIAGEGARPQWLDPTYHFRRAENHKKNDPNVRCS